MDEVYQDLIEILEASIKKNGIQPLTNQWLLNILKLARNQAHNEPPDITGDGPDGDWF